MCYLLDRERSEFAPDMCSVSLERHAATLRKLSVLAGAVRNLPVAENTGIDFRWFTFPNLPALKHLNLDRLTDIGDSIFRLTALTHLEALSFFGMTIEDEDMKALLPSLSQLRTVELVHCQSLSCLVLQWLPLDLDLLNVSYSNILTSPPGAEGNENSHSSSKARKGRRSVSIWSR